MSEKVELSEHLISTRTDEDIRVAVEQWRRDPALAEAMYGHISNWITTAVTNMAALFYDARNFNDDISEWDVSNVTNMHRLFDNASSFNCDISNWETGKVTCMSLIFFEAHSFRCDVSEWDLSALDDIRHAFHDCPVNFRTVWWEHKDDMEWKEHCRRNRELRREQIREQRRRDANWERRRPWMMVISPFLRQEGITESPVQSVFDIPGLARHINSFV